MKKKSTEQFIKECEIIHNNEFDYSLVEYINNKTKIKIICKKHGIFEQIPQDHLRNHKCPICSDNKKYDNETFIKKCKEFCPQYDYSLVEYKNNKSKVKLICKTHGIFEVRPDHFLKRISGECLDCKGIVHDIDSFIKKSNLIHNNEYNYDESIYKGNEIKLKIKCNKHGIFEQTPHNHLNGNKCPNCSNNKKLTNEDFIKKSIAIHNNIYKYDKTEYINTNTDVIILCEKHGYFKQKPYIHLSGCGCQICNNSKGEEKIRLFLVKNDLQFEREKRFDDCRDINPLPFDFFLPMINTCIEFDGEQHFHEKEVWGGKENFKKIQEHDKIKNDYCKNNNINLIRIKNSDINKIENIIYKVK